MSLPSWAQCSVIAALILLSPVVAFLMVIAAEVLIDWLLEAGVNGVCAVAAAAIGGTLSRRLLRRPGTAPQPGTERVSDEGAIAARPI